MSQSEEASLTTGFGEYLRREREMRGVSLEEISAATKISIRFLQAIENEELTKLPGGIFTRSFVRTYARYLGLDEERVLADCQLAGKQKAEVEHPAYCRQPRATGSHNHAYPNHRPCDGGSATGRRNCPFPLLAPSQGAAKRHPCSRSAQYPSPQYEPARLDRADANLISSTV